MDISFIVLIFFNDYNVKSNIEILFDDESDILATENGLHIKDSWINFESVTIVNCYIIIIITKYY